jgi:hypothetical protein
MHKVRENYSSCTGRSSENLCSSSGGGADEKRTTGSNSGTTIILAEFSENLTLCTNDQTQGTGAVFS